MRTGPCSAKFLPSSEKSALGKQRSQNNALKHGIFGKAVLLPGESTSEFDALLAGYRSHFQPVGAYEEDLVETLVVNCWRWRRLLMAENAEIQAGTRFIKWDRMNRDQEEADRIQQVYCNGGLMRRIANGEALARCQELLQELKASIESHGFDHAVDQPILTVLYGNFDPKHWENNLFRGYFIWAELANVSDECRKKFELNSPEQYRKNFLEELNEEIKRLASYERERTSVESDRTKLEKLRLSVPESPRLDALLRYAGSLERSFERTLNQLERAQRMRLGQAVPPPVNIIFLNQEAEFLRHDKSGWWWAY